MRVRRKDRKEGEKEGEKKEEIQGGVLKNIYFDNLKCFQQGLVLSPVPALGGILQ